MLAGSVPGDGVGRRGKEEEHGEARGRGLRTGVLREEAGNEPPARSGGGREDGSKGGGGGCWLDGADGGRASIGWPGAEDEVERWLLREERRRGSGRIPRERVQRRVRDWMDGWDRIPSF